MAGGSSVKPDTAVTLPISKLAALLGIKPTLLADILGTTHVELRDQPKIVAGGIDAEREMGFWTFFNKIGLIHIVDVPREANIHDYKRQCTNGAVNAGAHTVKIEPAENSILIVNFISVINQDAAARNAHMYLYSAGAVIISELNSKANLGANGIIFFPTPELASNRYALSPPLNLTDAFEIGLGVAAVAVNEESSYFISYSYIGDAPVITETGPAGSAFADVS